MMTDNNSTPESGQDSAENHGFTQQPVIAPASLSRAAQRQADKEIRRRNLLATFGSGPGKLSLIAVAVIVIVFSVLAISSYRNTAALLSKAQVDVPTSPPTKITNNSVTPDEAARRAAQSVQEADAAQNKGGSYQPGFDYNIGPSGKLAAPPESAKFSGLETTEEESARAASSASSARNMLNQAPPANSSQQSQQQLAEQQRREQDQQRTTDRLATEQKSAEGDREKYVESLSQDIVKQIDGMFSAQGGASLNNLGSYSQASYYTATKDSDASARNSSASQRTAAVRKAIIKAGNTMYATLDSEVNTDDGRIVMATIRSGPWKGSKLIGQIEESYSNVSLNFITLAPQDDRSTVRIRAVALREQDAKLGMAERIDHHTLSRYSSLAAAALMQGAGRVYQQPIGTTAITNGGIVTTTEQPQRSQIIGSAVGEVGIAVGAEIRRRGYDQPSTYSTPAETGFILYFLEDVLPNSGEEQQQKPAQQQTQNPPSLQGNPPTAPGATYPGGAQGGQGGYSPAYNPGFGIGYGNGSGPPSSPTNGYGNGNGYGSNNNGYGNNPGYRGGTQPYPSSGYGNRY